MESEGMEEQFEQVYRINPYPNEHSLRLRDPGDFDPKTFRRTNGSGKAKVQGVAIPASIAVIWGKLKGKAGKDDPPLAQALRFRVEKWGRSPAKAKAWIKKKGLKGEFEPAAAAKAKENQQRQQGILGPLLFYTLVNRAYTPEYKVWRGERHLVVPVTLLVEGVHNGIYYPAEELATFPESWSGIPLSLNHPKDPSGEPISCNEPQVLEQKYLGRLWNVIYDDNERKLKGEAWFSVEDTRLHAPDLLEALLQGLPVEVSTGLWGNEEIEEGEWNGEEYYAILRDYRPDHLAILPQAEGACNWEDGCGIRANNQQEVNGMEVNIRSTARTPSYSGTESVSWAGVSTGFKDYRDAYYRAKGNKPDNPDDIPGRAKDAPAAMKTWIASKTLLGDPKATSTADLIFFPVVNPKTDNLNEGALRSVISGRGAQADISASAKKSAQDKARSLLDKEFGTKLRQQKKIGTAATAVEVVKQLGTALGLQVQEASFDAIRSQLQDVLDARVKEEGSQQPEEVSRFAWVIEVFKNYFIFEARDTDGVTKLYKQKYRVSGDQVQVSGDPVEVVREVNYKELQRSTASPLEENNEELGSVEDDNPTINEEEEDSIMNKKEELVTKLITNEENCSFCENDKEWLEKLEEEQLEKLVALQEAKTVTENADPGDEGDAEKDTAAPATNESDSGDVSEPEATAAKTPEEFIANAPVEMQEVLAEGLRMHRQRRQGLIETILGNKRNKFSKEKLEKMGLEDLEALAELANVPVDFSLKPGGVSTKSEPNVNEKHEDGTGIPEPPRPVWNEKGEPDYSHLQ